MNPFLNLYRLASLIVDNKPMTEIGTPLIATYDIRLVLLSIAIATIASYTALELAGQIKVTTGRWRLLWLSGGAIALGWLDRRQPMPFGPFLALGAGLTIFWGEAILSTYLRLFFPLS